MSDVVLIALAALYLWYLLAHASLLDRPLRWPRTHWSPLIGCPWCAGWWLTGALTLVTGYGVLEHLAAAALVGLAGRAV